MPIPTHRRGPMSSADIGTGKCARGGDSTSQTGLCLGNSVTSKVTAVLGRKSCYRNPHFTADEKRLVNTWPLGRIYLRSLRQFPRCSHIHPDVLLGGDCFHRLNDAFFCNSSVSQHDAGRSRAR